MRNNYFGTDSRDDVFLATSTTRETFYGRGGDDRFTFYNGTNPWFDRDFSDRFIGGSGNDLIYGLNVGFTDYKTYQMLSFAGGKGYDTVRYDVTDSITGTETISMDLGKFETLERGVELHQFFISAVVTNGADADLDISGNSGDETVSLSMSLANTNEFESGVEVSVLLGGGRNTFEFVGHQRIETNLVVKTGKGADTIHINDSSTSNSNVSGTSIATGRGKDLVVLEGMHKETVKLGGGGDTIYALSGGFGDASDVVFTGKGKDRIFLELDEYSKMLTVKDFNADNDVFVFDEDEFRDTTVTFDAAVAAAATDPMLYMNNATNELFFGDNLLVEFSNNVTLTAANFETGEFLF